MDTLLYKIESKTKSYLAAKDWDNAKTHFELCYRDLVDDIDSNIKEIGPDELPKEYHDSWKTAKKDIEADGIGTFVLMSDKEDYRKAA